ncbi:LysR family transcriptional regulator [Burkholderia multivorans]|uniref:LysR family transcriptional regulator n=1 Tax=Burkholderia multivorans TaxID=87883 RepID=A0A8E2UUL9_9BURK|nr:LysR family transcriptional regulator [Burkholderia multivorans]AJY15203.1 bacterial regulatory helix-turn-helix, lysR family protein [Burkholderia multivorans ATCC BAA-247]AVR20307.1 LysR family transcriptional regulator [Burkholderia multivorans]EJO54783.1 transcriptional regulator, LysR family [Burkholderia multivorans ATCC BAA-247]MBU9318414.1 LysR family transcriptional regulator [Burkholderia multivorans]MBU9336618.1 LysR family transcriptional regulator [Burkholderia multivorans]
MNLLEAMRIYVAVVEHGGLPGAASELKLAAAHVSDRIDGLERYLGCRLLLRCADDGIACTDAGIAFHQCCVRTLSAVDDATADAGIRPPDAHVAEARRAAPHALHAARR